MLVDFLGMRLEVEEEGRDLGQYWYIKEWLGRCHYCYIPDNRYCGFKFGLVILHGSGYRYTIYLTAPFDDPQQMSKMIHEHYVRVSDTYIVYPGHVNYFLILVHEWIRRVLWQNVIALDSGRPISELIYGFAERMGD